MNVYERITILSNERVNNKVLCRCECGTEKWINIFNIRNGDVKSCGCLKKEKMKLEAKKRFSGKVAANFKDYTGNKIGLCIVLNRIHKDCDETWWLLRCECGTEFETRLSNLRRCKYEKCKCGFPKHILRGVLGRMIDRCKNEKHIDFKWYGKKGIAVCDEWVKFPIKFIQWSLSNGWKKGLTIDRKNSKGNYEPNNCQWITRRENSSKAAIERWERSDLG